MRANLRKRFKYFFFKRKSAHPEIANFLFKKLGYMPSNINLFLKALTHKSFSNSRDDVDSNERLEYLGDTVIDLIVAEHLFQKFPGKDEGYLTKVKAKIVNRKMLSYIGGELQLESFIRYRKGRSLRISTIEGNALEALMGAIYLDSDFQTAKEVFESCIIKRYINFNEVLRQEMDFKSALLIWGQKNKLDLSFDISDEATKDNNFMYTAVVIINHKEWGMGKGPSKKEAEQNASNQTMLLLGIRD